MGDGAPDGARAARCWQARRVLEDDDQPSGACLTVTTEHGGSALSRRRQRQTPPDPLGSAGIAAGFAKIRFSAPSVVVRIHESAHFVGLLIA